VNANQVFYWRTLYHGGRLGGAAEGAALLPVTISEPAVSEASAVTASSGCRIEPESGPDPARRTITPGTIHIQLPKAQLSIEGGADAPTLRAVLEMLRG
jgi:hypothetical protein